MLKYDSNNEDATKELYKCHTLQLMVSTSIAVLGIRTRNWLVVFKDWIFCRLLYC